MPDTRTCVVGGLFFTTWMIFIMIFVKPVLAKDTFFDAIAEAIVVTGLVAGAVAYYFGSMKKEPVDPNATTSATTTVTTIPQQEPPTT